MLEEPQSLLVGRRPALSRSVEDSQSVLLGRGTAKELKSLVVSRVTREKPQSPLVGRGTVEEIQPLVVSRGTEAKTTSWTASSF